MTAAAIATATTRLRRLCQRDVQASWHGYAGDLSYEPDTTCPAIDPSEWAIAPQNDKGYLIWEAGRKVQWYVQRWVLPERWDGYPLAGLTLRLALTWWAEDAQIFANGQFVQAGDLFDSSARVVLAESVEPGQAIAVALRLVSPGHDIGGLMRSRLLCEAPTNDLATAIDPGFVADEIDVLAKYAAAFAPERLEAIAAVLNPLDWSQVGVAPQFDRELRSRRQALAPLAADLKQRRITMLGHAHLDMAWLWELPETYDAAERTFRSVLKLRREFPALTFCHTSPALYEWFASERPELFAEIQAASAAGNWEPLGGMWVEPDANLPNGEAMVRQLLYGQRYTREQFGSNTRVAWLTDTFGFHWQLPQLLKLGGIDYFVTQKLHWNDSTEFPHGVFWWQAPDGTRVLALMSPPNVTGVMDTNPQTVTNYSVKWEQQTGLAEIFWLPGVGDRGGGPTRDMLTVQARWQQSPFFPNLEFGNAEPFLDRLAALEPATEFPVWPDELYVELHRGCYTAHADQKWLNRRAEGLLYEAELLASLAVLSQQSEGSSQQSEFVYPQAELETAWKQVLFNQFHDILPGTSIPGVFVTANVAWRAAIATAETLIEQALTALLVQIQLEEPPDASAQPWLVFNTLNWVRSETVEISVSEGNWQARDRGGQLLPSQMTAEGNLLVFVADIPALGYAPIWLQPVQSDPHAEHEGSEPQSTVSLRPVEGTQNWQLENQGLRVEIDGQTGSLASVFDRQMQREVLSGAGNELQFFRDAGQYWDAWNIAPDYEQQRLPGATVKAIEALEAGPVRSRLRVTYQFQHSTFQQDYSLTAQSPIFTIATAVDWQEQHVMVKAAWPLALDANVATYEIPCGAIERPTRPETPSEKAKWEVCGQRWADLTAGDGEWGASVLNDGKYGHDHQPGRLRLTLLRAPQWPHPDCDRGRHRFTYALYPHSGGWQAAQTVRRAAELNVPLRGRAGSESAAPSALPPEASLLAVTGETLVAMALKRSEDEPETFILRVYEACGQASEATIRGWLAPQLVGAVDGLEQSTGEAGDRLRPWQIRSLAFRLNSARR